MGGGGQDFSLQLTKVYKKHALGPSQDNRAAPFDHRKVPVRFSVYNGIQNRAETVRLPPGSPTVHLRAFYGLLYGLSTACLQSYGLMKAAPFFWVLFFMISTCVSKLLEIKWSAPVSLNSWR